MPATSTSRPSRNWSAESVNETSLRRFLHPRFWPTWLGLGLLWLSLPLSQASRRRLGRGLGRVLWLISPRRRHVVDVNLRLSFPDLSDSERRRLARESYAATGMTVLEVPLAWWGADKRLPPYRIEGMERVEEALRTGRGILMIGSHFAALEISGRLFTPHHPASVVYKPARNPLFNEIMRRGRERLFIRAIANRDLRGMIRELRHGGIVWYAPDQDMGRSQSVFAPFMGVPAATVSMTSRILKMTDAVPLGFFPIREGDGYVIRIVSMPDVTGEDAETDAANLNRHIEAEIRRHPEQYFWLHRRFKTRPDGEPRIYNQ